MRRTSWRRCRTRPRPAAASRRSPASRTGSGRRGRARSRAEKKQPAQAGRRCRANLPKAKPARDAGLRRALACQRRSRRRRRARTGCTRSSTTAIASRSASRTAASKLLSRQGLDWTERFPVIAKALAEPAGQDRPHRRRGRGADRGRRRELHRAGRRAEDRQAATSVLYAFDLLHLDGFDLRDAPLKARKAALAKLLAADGEDGRIRFSDHIAGDGDTVFRHASRLGLEGIVSKKLSSPYRSGRVKSWLKVEVERTRQLRDRGLRAVDRRRKNAIGALVLGEYVDGKLVPVGHVGSGFSAADARASCGRGSIRCARRRAPLKDETRRGQGRPSGSSRCCRPRSSIAAAPAAG